MFKVTIENLKANEVEEFTSDCVICAASVDDKIVSIGLTDCTNEELMQTIKGVFKETEKDED